MKLCSRHQQDLLDAIKKKGMWKFVAPDDHKMGINLIAWLKGQTTKETFDPLVIASLEINKKAIQYCGPYVKGKNPAGLSYCPICETQKSLLMATLDTQWIDTITDVAYAVALTNGFITGADIRAREAH